MLAKIIPGLKILGSPVKSTTVDSMPILDSPPLIIIFKSFLNSSKTSWALTGLNPDERERWRGHPWFDKCEQFCRDWDQMSFDPDYETKSLSYFEPMLREIFSRPAFDKVILKEPSQF